jgi:hypothetical protein
MRAYLFAAAVALAALALGLWTTQAALTGALPVAVDRLGPWRAAARDGSPEAGPYVRARVERSGEIPLGLGEGLRLAADVDSDGRPLDAACVYRVGPRAPPARYWTLEAVDDAGLPIENVAQRYVLRSSEILREPDGGFWIWVSARVHSGNWLPLGAPRGFALTLRLYDPALTGLAAATDSAAAPRIERVRCG